MRIAGSLIFLNDARRLVAGANLDIERARFMPNMLARLKIGDLIWPKEPWALVKPRRFGGGGFEFALAGPPDAPRTKEQKAALKRAGECRLVPQRAQTLAREDSRATLEVTAILEHVVLMLVHMQQIDAFSAARRAA